MADNIPKKGGNKREPRGKGEKTKAQGRYVPARLVLMTLLGQHLAPCADPNMPYSMLTTAMS